MKRFPFVPLIALTVTAGGCRSDAGTPQMSAFATEHTSPASAPAVLMRLTNRELRFYNFPELQDAGWSIPRNGLRVGSIVGFAPRSQQLFVQADSVLAVIDVAAGLVRVVDSNVRLATVGPDGVPYVVGTRGSVGAIEQRRVAVWMDSVALRTVGIWGAIGGRLLAETPTADGRSLRLFSAGSAPTLVLAPAGPMAVPRWGEIVAIATPSSIELVDTRDGETSSIEVLEGPTQVAFSASGHMLFATTVAGRLLWFDRFSGARIGSVALDGSPAGMRVGMWGRFLFVRDAATDTVTVFDMHRGELAGKLTTRWTAITPAVAPNGTIVLRQEDAIIALDPNTMAEVGRVAGQPGDVWAVADWHAVRPVAQQADVAAPQESGGERELYVQVSSSQNQAWAVDLRDRLNLAGMNASVMEPDGTDDLYRVVLGPFDSRPEAELAGRSLGRPYWIFSRAESRDNR